MEKNINFVCYIITKQNIARLQKAALSTSHRLMRCQIILTKRIFKVMSEIEFCQNLSLDLSEFKFGVLSELEFCQNIIFRVLSEFLFFRF